MEHAKGWGRNHPLPTQAISDNIVRPTVSRPGPMVSAQSPADPHVLKRSYLCGTGSFVLGPSWAVLASPVTRGPLSLEKGLATLLLLLPLGLLLVLLAPGGGRNHSGGTWLRLLLRLNSRPLSLPTIRVV